MNTTKFAMKLAIPLFVALAYGPAQGLAAPTPILGADLSTFAVLGATMVTNVLPTTVTGNVGVAPGSALGLNYTFAVGGTGTHSNDTLANDGQTQLTQAFTSLGLMSTGTPILNGDLGGLTLTSGVYSVSAAVPTGGFNLGDAAEAVETLTLDAGGLANPFWVFKMQTTLITGTNTVVKFTNNTNPNFNPGVFWVLDAVTGGSATLGVGSTFLGNILADTSITVMSKAIMGCGGAYADNAAVTLDENTITRGCNGGLEIVSAGDIPTQIPTNIPEPETYAMLLAGLGMMGFVARRRQRNLAAAA